MPAGARLGGLASVAAGAGSAAAGEWAIPAAVGRVEVRNGSVGVSGAGRQGGFGGIFVFINRPPARIVCLLLSVAGSTSISLTMDRTPLSWPK